MGYRASYRGLTSALSCLCRGLTANAAAYQLSYSSILPRNQDDMVDDELKREIGQASLHCRLRNAAELDGLFHLQHFVFGFEGFEPSEAIIKLIRDYYVGYGCHPFQIIVMLTKYT